MDNQARLLQTFEDEYFKIMIQEMAEEDGKRLLEENRRLNDDSSFVVPETLRRKCLTEINKGMKTERRGVWGKRLRKGFIRVAVAIFICSSILTISFAASKTFRAATLNLLITLFGDHSEISYNQESHNSTSSTYDISVIEFGCVPDGYTLTQEYSNPPAYRFENANTGRITIEVLQDIDDPISVDTEDATQYPISIQGYDALYYTKDSVETGLETITLVLPLESYEDVVVITSEGLTIDELTMMAEQMTFIP